MDNRDQPDKKRTEEYRKHPAINLADAINRSVIGDPNALTGGSWHRRMITLVIVIAVIIFLVKVLKN